jgi:hypothetical protein
MPDLRTSAGRKAARFPTIQLVRLGFICKKVTIHPIESNINQGLPQACSEQSRTIAQIPQILIQSILSIFTKQIIEDLFQSAIIGEISGKKAFLGLDSHKKNREALAFSDLDHLLHLHYKLIL